MRIAAFNVENLFERAKAFNEEDDDKARKVIEAVAELNGLFEKQTYSDSDKEQMLDLKKNSELTAT